MSLSRQLAFSFLFFFSDIFNSFTLFPLIANSTGMFVHFYFLCSNKLYWLVWRPRNLLLREIRLSNIFNSFSTLFLTSVPLSITFIIAERGKQQPQVVYSPIYYHNFKLLSSIFYNFFSFYKTT